MMQQSELSFGQTERRPFQFGGADRPWRRGPASPVIWPNEVHVWKINLKATGLSENRDTLSNDERVRASRFRFHTDSDRFIAARSSLRTILSRYLWTQPAELEFGLTAFGNPHLAATPDQLVLRFSVSPSNDRALLAVPPNT